MLYQTLHNGVKIPMLGLGTYKLNGDAGLVAVKQAIEGGYRHIDTASYYENEKEIGTAIRESNIPRSSFFITSKVWETDQGYDATLRAFEKTLRNLQTDYLDLYLIHWPHALSLETWRAMEYLYENRRVRAIGVSNFSNDQLDVILESAKIKPMVNQIERHPYMTRVKECTYNQNQGIVVEAWRPILRGALNEDITLKQLAHDYHKSISQIVLRWHLQTGCVAIPKSSNPKRQAENIDIFDFELTDDQIESISNLHQEDVLASDRLITKQES